MLWRHGDVFIAKVDSIPEGLESSPRAVLAYGEVTGHSHRIRESGAAVTFQTDDAVWLRILTEEATLVHEEHGPIVLRKGDYRTWIQREYSPDSIRRVID